MAISLARLFWTGLFFTLLWVKAKNRFSRLAICKQAKWRFSGLTLERGASPTNLGPVWGSGGKRAAQMETVSHRVRTEISVK